MSSADFLASMWKITREHLNGTYVSEGMVDTGEHIKSFDFFAYDYPHVSGSSRYDLEDFSQESDERNKSRYDSMSIFSWIEVLASRHAPKNLPKDEYEELELNLLRLVGIWGHTHGFRIKNHIKYFESIQDDYLLNYMLGKALEEKYSGFGVDSDSSQLLVSRLNGPELNLLIQEDLQASFREAGVDLKLREEDEFAWIQKIKNILASDKQGSISFKKNLIDEVNQSQETASYGSKIIGLRQILVTRGSVVLVNLAYAEVRTSDKEDPHGTTEILGCFCGASGGWNYFHGIEPGDTLVFEEYPTNSNIPTDEIAQHLTQIEEARNELLNLDDEGNILGVSNSGEEFLSDFHDYTSSDGVSFAKTDGAEYDYIEEIQGQWDLNFEIS